jgi:2-haloacid dehalogenase
MKPGGAFRIGLTINWDLKFERSSMNEAIQKSPSIIVFDVGNVLIHWDPRRLYSQLFDSPEEVDWFLKNVCHSQWNLDLDRGLAIEDAIAERITAFPEHAAAIRAYDERWDEMVSGAIEGSVALIKRLRAGGRPLYAITNFSRAKFDRTAKRFPFLQEFDGIVVSADEGLVKPDPNIFDLFLKRFGLTAEDCLFIDDSAANVQSARKLGMAAHLFVDAASLEIELERFQLL